mmetsp:Transcript_14809/g.44629  ORF Transcript_14809/g.44629 Transcript_14809/m.44629 type:complete len:306 (+) Transcript_14809:122-1039(+)
MALSHLAHLILTPTYADGKRRCSSLGACNLRARCKEHPKGHRISALALTPPRYQMYTAHVALEVDAAWLFGVLEWVRARFTVLPRRGERGVDAGVHDVKPQGRAQAGDEDHSAVARRKLRRRLERSQYLVAAPARRVVVAVALQLEEEIVGNAVTRVPRMEWRDLLNLSHAIHLDDLAPQAVVLQVVDELEEHISREALDEEELGCIATRVLWNHRERQGEEHQCVNDALEDAVIHGVELGEALLAAPRGLEAPGAHEGSHHGAHREGPGDLALRGRGRIIRRAHTLVVALQVLDVEVSVANAGK